METVDPFPGNTPCGPGERELLHAVSDLIDADREMRHSMCGRMHLWETDLRALRFTMKRARSGSFAAPRDVASHLGITTAATTTLLDRLVRAGHVERRPHSRDGRSKVVVPTAHAWAEVRGQLAGVHDRMQAVVAATPADAQPAVLAFLRDLREAMRADAMPWAATEAVTPGK